MKRLGAEIKTVTYIPHEWDVHVVNLYNEGSSAEAIRDATVAVEVHPVVALATHAEESSSGQMDLVRSMIWDYEGPTRRPWLIDAEDRYDPAVNCQVIGVFHVGEQPTPEQIEAAANRARAGVWRSAQLRGVAS